MHRDATLWLEGRPLERGRVALMRASGGRIAELLPGRSVRTRVHEYGGGAYAVDDAGIAFVDDADQQVWWRPEDGEPRRLSAAPGCRFADLAFDATRARLVAVLEAGRTDAHRPRHAIVAVPLDGSGHRELVAGAAFYAAPRVVPDGRRLCWIEWDAADMPWDASRLQLAMLDDAGSPQAPRTLAGGPAESVLQPEWAADGALWSISDANGRWQLERHADGVRQRITDDDRERGLPLWQLGMRCYGLLDAHTPVAAGSAAGTWRIERLGAAPLALASELTQIDHLHAADGRIVVLGGGPGLPAAVIEVDARDGRCTVLRGSTELELGDGPALEALAFASGDARAWALLHPPLEARGVPPMVVRCHGGPTAAASSALDPRVRAWTARGYAFLDVDYRGSTGFGRAYRDALRGGWGVVDVADCIAAAAHCATTGRADPSRIAVLGSSAGGFTALGALAAGDAFRCGCVQYPVADLVTAMRDTHAFEARYGDRLLGPWPDAEPEWIARSPLARVASITAPVAFFQGEADPVVPRDQTARMVAALSARGVPCEAYYFEGEGHGFRSAETIERVIAAELAFVARHCGTGA